MKGYAPFTYANEEDRPPAIFSGMMLPVGSNLTVSPVVTNGSAEALRHWVNKKIINHF
ncbi:MAG: hypothetical protein Q8K00_16500 [Syntrophales bacterium]|nr:hypothetical protein [Syntrophales bacterium]